MQPASPSRLADSLTRLLASINAGAATLLLAALLVAGVWQDAALDLVSYIAVALALHGAGLLAAASIYAFRWLALRVRSSAAARASRYLAVSACVASAACFAAGIGVIVWAGVYGMESDSGYDEQSHSLPLEWSRGVAPAEVERRS